MNPRDRAAFGGLELGVDGRVGEVLDVDLYLLRHLLSEQHHHQLRFPRRGRSVKTRGRREPHGSSLRLSLFLCLLCVKPKPRMDAVLITT
jgi:hypothetical protein